MAGSPAFIRIADATRSVTFAIKNFALAGVTLSHTFDLEAELLEEMIGTPIDPEELKCEVLASEALRKIASNTSGVCCARLLDCYSHAHAPALAPGVSIGVAPPQPVRFDELPAVVLQQVACLSGTLCEQRSLGATSRALRAAVVNSQVGNAKGSPGLAVPVWGPPARGSCSPSVVSWDGAKSSLTKTARPGHPLVIFDEMLASRPALLELELRRISSFGAVQIGVLALLPRRYGQAEPSADAADRICFDGAGRVHLGTKVSRAVETILPYGDSFREGDTIGLLYIATPRASHAGGAASWASASVALVRQGRLLGKPVPLRCPAADGGDGGSGYGRPRGFRFFLRFDSVAGSEVRLITSRRVPIDAEQLLRLPLLPPRPPPASPQLIVRTMGPDSQALRVNIDPASGSVGELRAAAAPLLGVGTEQLALRLGAFRSHGAAPVHADLQDDGASLDELGIRVEPSNGSQLVDVYMHVPHLIS